LNPAANERYAVAGSEGIFVAAGSRTVTFK